MSKNFEIVADPCIANKHMAIIGACHINLTTPVIAIEIKILRKNMIERKEIVNYRLIHIVLYTL